MGETPEILGSLSSPPGEGAIGVIEVLGGGAIELADGVFRSPSGRRLTDAPPGDLLYGRIVEGDRPLDEVLVRIVSVDPERLEINCHGGPAPHAAVMDLLTRLGVRECSWRELALTSAAEEGLDAIRREALVRIPGALTLSASLMLVAQYNGALSGLLESEDLLERRAELLSLAPYGLAMTDPPQTVIAGKPNVGKSTLANALLGRERVLAAPVPGTTRDAVASFISIGGVPLRLVDTAGLGHAAGEIEKLAADRALEVLRRADIVLCVLDGSSPISGDDERVLKECAARNAVVVINKCDLARDPSAATAAAGTGKRCVEISALKKTGLDELKEAVLDTLFPAVPEDISLPIPFTARQVSLLDKLDASNTMEARRELLWPEPGGINPT
jgi:tRNA modification GTPase